MLQSLILMLKPKKVKGLVPAKNKDKIGLANPDSKKFYQLDSIKKHHKVLKFLKKY